MSVDRPAEDGWLINKTGFPLTDDMWDRMWTRAEANHPKGSNMSVVIRSAELPKVPFPTQPILKISHSVPEKLEIIQKYISDLQYDYTGTQFFEIKKSRPLCRLMDVAKSIMKESLPIKCLEAVILALYLSTDITSIQRFPIAFKTSFEGNTYKHIVLGVSYMGRYGALGLSRRATLMYKSISHDNISELLAEYIRCYEQCHHTVLRIKLGLPVSHERQSMEHIIWKHMTLRPGKMTEKEFKTKCASFVRQIRGRTIYKSSSSSKLTISDVSDGDTVKETSNGSNGSGKKGEKTDWRGWKLPV